MTTLTNAQSLTKSEEALILSGDVKMALPVIQVDVPSELAVLKATSAPVNPKDKNVKVLVDRMLLAVQDPMHAGVGIAAPQVGINRQIIWVQRLDKKNEPFEVYFNPKITWASNLLRKGAEGCLSIADTRGEVYRHYAIELEYQNLKGQWLKEKVEGFTAVIFQHEIDHLNGILFTDRLEEQTLKSFAPLNESVEFFIQRP